MFLNLYLDNATKVFPLAIVAVMKFNDNCTRF